MKTENYKITKNNPVSPKQKSFFVLATLDYFWLFYSFLFSYNSTVLGTKVSTLNYFLLRPAQSEQLGDYLQLVLLQLFLESLQLLVLRALELG